MMTRGGGGIAPLQSHFVLVSVVPYSQALFCLDALVLSCFQAGDQKDGAEPGGTTGAGSVTPAGSQGWG